MSRATEWQRRMRESGRCTVCAEPCTDYAGRCNYHAAYQREHVRNAYRKKHGIPLDAPVGAGRPRRKA